MPSMWDISEGYACALHSGDKLAANFLTPPFFESFTLVWLSNADLNIFVDDFIISPVANFRDAQSGFLLVPFFSLFSGTVECF